MKQSAFRKEKDPFYIYLKIQTNLIDDATDKAKAKRVYNLIKDSKQNVVYSNLINNGVKILTEYLDKKNKKYEILYGGLSKEQRNKMVKRFNEGKVDTLIITDAAKEGVDLKGTRNIVLLNPPWSHALLKQIVGRAIRYRSHLHLPENERFVNVRYIRAVPPRDIYEKQQKAFNSKPYRTCTLFEEDHPDLRLTADQCIYDMIIAKKESTTQDVLEFLKRMNINDKFNPILLIINLNLNLPNQNLNLNPNLQNQNQNQNLNHH